jgi:hypothetical protein
LTKGRLLLRLIEDKARLGVDFWATTLLRRPK